ncbi:hypothetical protein GCM10009551_033860 [Nocardiopsis tropica]
MCLISYLLQVTMFLLGKAQWVPKLSTVLRSPTDRLVQRPALLLRDTGADFPVGLPEPPRTRYTRAHANHLAPSPVVAPPLGGAPISHTPATAPDRRSFVFSRPRPVRSSRPHTAQKDRP